MAYLMHCTGTRLVANYCKSMSLATVSLSFVDLLLMRIVLLSMENVTSSKFAKQPNSPHACHSNGKRSLHLFLLFSMHIINVVGTYLILYRKFPPLICWLPDFQPWVFALSNKILCHHLHLASIQFWNNHSHLQPFQSNLRFLYHYHQNSIRPKLHVHWSVKSIRDFRT